MLAFAQSLTGPDVVVVVAHTAAHVAILGPLVELLAHRGVTSVFVTLESQWRALGAVDSVHRGGYRHCPYERFSMRTTRPRALIVLNDWVSVAVSMVEEANALGVPTIGIVEASKDWSQPHLYRTVRHVLAMGDVDLRYLGRPAELVGSPVIEAALRDPAVFPKRDLVAINYKFTYGKLEEDRERWLDTATVACGAVGVHYVVTQHPADDTPVTGHPVTTEPLAQVLSNCSALISRFSTAVLEAIARGKPVVYLQPKSEQIPTMMDPMGAYPIVTCLHGLVPALEEALVMRESNRERTGAFLRFHVSIDPSLPAVERIAEAVIRKMDAEPVSSTQRVGADRPKLSV